jgi:hypothetical protein
VKGRCLDACNAVDKSSQSSCPHEMSRSDKRLGAGRRSFVLKDR